MYSYPLWNPIIQIVSQSKELYAIGKRIQELRTERNLTQAELAEHSELTTNYIGKIERGEVQPTLNTLFAIAQALGADPSMLFVHLDKRQNKKDIKMRIRELLELL